MPKVYSDIIDATADNRTRAYECLRRLDRIADNDGAREETVAAAQVFATLHLADVVGETTLPVDFVAHRDAGARA